MANYGMADLTIKTSRSSATVASSATGMLPMQQYIRKINGITLEAVVVDSHAFGDSFKESLYAGIKGMKDISFGGYYDDVAASGPHLLYGQTTDVGAERYHEIDFGSSDVVNFRAIILEYTRHPVVEDLTEFEVVMRPTGPIATAT